MKREIEPLLLFGEENAVPAALLASVLRIDQRRLRKQIAEERQDGALICSSVKGYFRPAKREEIQKYMNCMKKRAKHSFIAIRSARRALNEIDGQQEMRIDV